MKTCLQYINCNLCGNNNTRHITVQNEFEIVECKTCGLVYVNPAPCPEHMIELYSSYHTRDSKNPESWAMLMENNFKHAAEILQRFFLNPPFRTFSNVEGNGFSIEKRSLLDVGCGYGYFLDLMRDKGWDVTGIEPSASILKFARDKKLNVIEGAIENIGFPENSFDAVTMFYVLEHLANPCHELKKIFSMLRPKGMLVLRVPHTTPIVSLLSIFGIKNNLYDPPFHLYDFSPETIAALLKKAGFSTIRIHPGRPTTPSNYLERMIAMLSTNFARLVFTLTMGSVLLPGVSKTIIAVKNVKEQR